ncbi:MAG: tetratricopeptide repeat protein [Anaerolineae bacterium]
MAEIALRDYLAEIETLIEGSSYDEAMACCRHILEQHPKYLEAYRLLGKAALEKEDDRAALDVFQRVLSVDPEDFVARVGLSIVYDRQGALDDALWQMERGFELMPSNDVIQSELRRLYGRRDGVSPERIALTRGALARMYAQGDLYAEAIAELRALLKESPDRVDLQVLLAEVLWRDDQRNEAASAAERVLDQLPYCLNANLVLGEIWLNSGFSEDGEMLLRRAQAVDPDNLRASTLLGAASPLSQQTTSVNRLEYHAPPGAGVEAEPAADRVPDWLAGLAGISLDQPESAGLPGLPAPPPAPPIELRPAGEVELPDWLRGISEAAPELMSEPGGAAIDESPDWMSGFIESPAESTDMDWLSQIEQPTLEQEAEAPDWLADLGVVSAEPAQLEAPPALEQTDMPDWLQALRPQAPEPVAPPVELPEVEESGIPEWMADVQETPAADQAFDFLQSLAQSAPVEPAEPVAAPWQAHAAPPSGIAEEPRVEQPAEMPSPPEPVMQEPLEPAALPSADEALAFLESLTAGKEDVLRAQAEREGEARLQAIIGARPGTLPLRPKPAEQVPEPPGAPEPAPAPMVLDELLSPEDALALLQSFAAGKEDELRAQAEREGEERMEAIMGGKPGTSPLRPKPAEQAPEPPGVPEPALAPQAELAEEPASPWGTVETAVEPAAAEEVEAPSPVDYWLQIADDQDEERMAADYFERALQPQPPAPKAEPAPEQVAAPVVPPIGAEEFQSRLHIDPDDHEAKLGLARVWWASGDRDQSLPLYQQLVDDETFLAEVAADLQRNLETVAHPDWYRALGDVHMKLGNLARALDAYREALARL